MCMHVCVYLYIYTHTCTHTRCVAVISDSVSMFLSFLWLEGEGEGVSGQTLCSERSELRRTERANASEASESSRMRAVVYLKLLTRQTKAPHITQTKNGTYHRLKAEHETSKNAGPGNSKQRS